MATAGKNEKNEGGKKGLLITLILLLVATNGAWLFFSLQQKNDLDEKTIRLNEQTVKIDSLNKEFELKIQELESMKQSILELGGDTTRLGEEIRQLQADMAKASRDARVYKARYTELQRDVDLIRANGQKEIDRLTALLNQQDTIIRKQKITIDEKEQNISKLNQEKEILQEKVTLASELKAQGFVIEALNPKGKARPADQVKAKAIDKLRIAFTLGENKVADVADREVIMRLVEPDGSALYELSTGGGEFTFEGKELYYTLKTNVLYDKKAKKVSFEYKKGSAYKAGTYTVQIYCENALIGESSFKVR